MGVFKLEENILLAKDVKKYKILENKYNELYQKYILLYDIVIKLQEDLSELKENDNKKSFLTNSCNDVFGDDPLYDEVVNFVVKTGKISASLIQRKYNLGYNRSARLIDLMEEKGVISSQNGSNPREVLIKNEQQ